MKPCWHKENSFKNRLGITYSYPCSTCAVLAHHTKPLSAANTAQQGNAPRLPGCATLQCYPRIFRVSMKHTAYFLCCGPISHDPLLFGEVTWHRCKHNWEGQSLVLRPLHHPIRQLVHRRLPESKHILKICSRKQTGKSAADYLDQEHSLKSQGLQLYKGPL